MGSGVQAPEAVMTGAQIRYIRQSIYGLVALVALFAFAQSYKHIYDLGLLHAQNGWTSSLLPLSVDLLIVVTGLMVWLQKIADERPRGIARWLPRMLLWGGIAATVAANVTYGLPHGWLAAVISAWPGVIFAALAEVVIVAVLPRRRTGFKATVITAGQPLIPSSSYEAAQAAYAASVSGGHALSEYQLHKRYGIPRSQARQICSPAAGQNANGLPH
jgi:Protein of unknown function (DUF2637)